MAKYLVNWVNDWSSLLANGDEKLSVMLRIWNMAKQDLDRGVMEDWGMNEGRQEGYFITEGTYEDVAELEIKYGPYVHFTSVTPLRTVLQVLETYVTTPEEHWSL